MMPFAAEPLRLWTLLSGLKMSELMELQGRAFQEDTQTGTHAEQHSILQSGQSSNSRDFRARSERDRV